MLVVTRKKGQSLLIGDDIEISIVGIEKGTVKLAINAPKEMTILRKELYTEVKEQNVESAKVDLNMLKSLKIK